VEQKAKSDELTSMTIDQGLRRSRLKKTIVALRKEQKKLLQVKNIPYP
jgi:hypothetical protein